MAKMSRSEAGMLGAIKTSKIQKQQREERVRQYNHSPSLCKNCKKELTYDEKIRKRVFCSHSCSASFSNARRIKNRNRCVVCDTACKTINATYCSSSCQQKYRRDEAIRNGTASFRTIKVHLMSVYNGCSICGSDTWLGKPILLIGDHIDGNSQNNTLKNIRLICSNCDATLPTYKARNIGNGRYYRRDRYANGQSF